MAPPIIDYLIPFKDTHITVASNLIEDAKRLAQKYPDKMDAKYIDVFNAKQMEELARNYDLVLSFIPPWLHMHVLKPCLDAGVNVVTSSYVSPAMMEIHEQVKAKGLIFLNECGLDPGIDILGTMKIVHEA